MEKRISGYTGLMGLFGSPVGHSASPEMYNFCFQHDGLDYAYMAFDVKAEDMPETIKTIRLLKMRGGNITMPCKNIGAKLMDRLSPAAQLVGACNAFVNEEGVLTGYITDGIGFVKNLKEHGVEVKGKKVLVLGAGGAATAIQVQLALEGTEEIQIFNRRDEFYERALETRKKLEEKVPQCKVAVNRLEDKEKLQKAVAEADILANATIVGMKPDLHEETLIPKEWMRKDLVVADIVYNPEVTRMLKEAGEAGCQTIEGKGMMLWQGAENYRLFTGKEMPVEAYKDAMRTAAAMPPSP